MVQNLNELNKRGRIIGRANYIFTPEISSSIGSIHGSLFNEDDTIVIDLNHPLAGAILQYELEIIEARPATSNDVCSEWDQQASSCQDNVCGSLIQEIVLQGEDFESN